MGSSPQEKETQSLLTSFKGFNPTVNNLFSDYQDPFSSKDIFGALDAYTKKATGDIGKATDTNIAKSRKATSKRFAGSGVTGGSIFEDAVAGGENNARVAGSDQIGSLLRSRLSQTPGVLNTANQSKFRNTSANQNVLFQNKGNELQKFGGLQGLIGMLPDDTTFDDILSVLNTAGGIGSSLATAGLFGGGGGAGGGR